MVQLRNGKFHGSLGSISWQIVLRVALELVVSWQSILVFSESGGGGFTLNRMLSGIKLYSRLMAHLYKTINIHGLGHSLLHLPFYLRTLDNQLVLEEV